MALSDVTAESVRDTRPSAHPLADAHHSASVLTADDVLRAVHVLQMRVGPDGRAKRHQPLTLLWAMGRARQKKARLAPWPVARSEIGALIRTFGRKTDLPQANLPFLALSSHKGLWQLSESPPGRSAGRDVRRQWLTNATPDVCGGLAQDVYDFMADTGQAAKVVAWLLGTYFEDIDPDRMLQAVGLADLASHIHLEQTEAHLTGLDLDAGEIDDTEKAARVAEALLQELGIESTVVDAEANRVESSQYQRRAAAMVAAITASLMASSWQRFGADISAGLLRVASRRTEAQLARCDLTWLTVCDSERVQGCDLRVPEI